MNQISPQKYATFLAILILLFGGAALAKGGLYIAQHEGDTVHMIEIIMRMVGGEIPHRDFSTPIGIFAFLPVVAVVKAGLSVGIGFIVAQILVAAFFAPLVWRVALSRLRGMSAWAFGLITIALILSLVHGENVSALSVSMHYNRWAWAAAFIAVFLSVFPPHEGQAAPRLDGVIVGAMMAILALIKPTYFIAFALPVALGFALRGARSGLIAALATGGLIAGLMVVCYGGGFFPAYIADLLSVALSDTRAAPGVSFFEILNGPRFLIGTVIAFLSVIVLRQSGREREGLILFLLLPGFAYVTYQNFGNDPKWLILLCLYILAIRPPSGTRVMFNADARNAVAALALAAFVLIAPSFQNILTSPFRHFVQKSEDYMPQFANIPEATDIYVQKSRQQRILVRQSLVDQFPQLMAYVDPEEQPDPVTFLGETLPHCVLQMGDLAVNRYMADRLKEPPFNFPPDSQFFVADVASEIWVSGGFAPLKGGAPWYYSGTPGIENADAIIVPVCAFAPDVQQTALEAIEAAGLTLRPAIRDDLMLVYPIVR